MSESNAPSAPSPLAPVQGEAVDESSVTFQWESAEEAETHHLQVARDRGFNQLLFDDETGPDASFTLEELPEQSGTALYWRVRARQGETWSAYSDAAPFEVADWTAGAAPAAIDGGAADFGMDEGRQSRWDWSAMMAVVVLTMVAVIATLVLFTDIDLGTDPEADAAEDEAMNRPMTTAVPDTAEINQYGVVDEEQGVYRMPIEEAMNEMVQNTEAAREAGSREP